MRIVAVLTLAVIAAGPVRAAQQSAVTPERPIADAVQPLDKDTLGVPFKALSQQADTEALKGNAGAGVWQMLGATVGPTPAVWLLNSSSGQLLFCTLGQQKSPGVICYTAPAAR